MSGELEMSDRETDEILLVGSVVNSASKHEKRLSRERPTEGIDNRRGRIVPSM